MIRNLPKYLKVLLFILVPIVLIIFLIYAYNDYNSIVDVAPPPPMTIEERLEYEKQFECKIGLNRERNIKNTGLSINNICLKNIETGLVSLKYISLNNDELLIYGINAPVAYIYNKKTSEFVNLTKPYEKLLGKVKRDNEDYDYINLKDNKYLLRPSVLFNANTNNFEKISKEKFDQYKTFISSRKDSIKHLKYIQTLNHQYHLYSGRVSYGYIFWMEDPVNLTRSKYYKIYNDDFASIMLNNNIYIFCMDKIILLNLKTGEKKDIATIDHCLVKPQVTKLPDESYLVNDLKRSNLYVFNPKTKSIKYLKDIKIGKVISLLENGTVFAYGVDTPFVLFDVNKQKIYPINEQLFVERYNESIMNIGNNTFLVFGGTNHKSWAIRRNPYLGIKAVEIIKIIEKL